MAAAATMSPINQDGSVSPVMSPPPGPTPHLHLPSMSTGQASPFLHPTGNVQIATQGSRRGSITDPEMHAHSSGFSDAGSRPGSSSQQEYERRDTMSGVVEVFDSGPGKRTAATALVNAKRKTSSDAEYVEGAESGGSSNDLQAKRRSSAYSDANRLAGLSLNPRRSSASSSNYSTSSSAGWSPQLQYGWQQQQQAPSAAPPPPGIPNPGYTFGAPTHYVAPHAYPADSSQAPKAGPLAEQLANYGFPPNPNLAQNHAAIGPLRRGSAPTLQRNMPASDASAPDPRRVFGSMDKQSDEEGQARSRTASVDDTNMDPSLAQHGSPYSRSPELRVSHKLAERKRRKEMTQLFDELREAVPTDRGSRSSKWETLVKAIDFINHLKDMNEELARDNDLMRAHIGIPGRSASLPFLNTGSLAAAAAASAGASNHLNHTVGHATPPTNIGLPPPPSQQAGESFVYGGAYVPHGLASHPNWPHATQNNLSPLSGGGQQTPRPGAAYMNAPPGGDTPTNAQPSR